MLDGPRENGSQEHVLMERGLNPQLPRFRAMLDAGGLWFGPPWMAPEEVIDQARDRGVRALEWQHRDISPLAELPQLEYLMLFDVEDPEPLYSLERLRGLHFSFAWDGRIDFQCLPRLEHFGVVECPRDEGGLDTLYAGHHAMRDLIIQRYRHTDLTPLSNLNLEKLEIGYTRKLTSLDGIEALAPTLRLLSLFACSNLPSMDGIEHVPELESLELATLRHIRTLEFTRVLPRLRRLHIFDLANVESLWPLAKHPSLEFLMFGRVHDLDLEPLTTLPSLKLFLTGSYRWSRDIHSFPQFLNHFPDEHPYVWEMRSLET